LEQRRPSALSMIGHTWCECDDLLADQVDIGGPVWRSQASSAVPWPKR
jgi:hypothetical protein